VSKKRIPPERVPDVFEAMSDEEFGKWVLSTLKPPPSTQIALRIPNPVLERAKKVAHERGVPYQGLMKALIEQGLDRLERMTA
jgi:predicted DNA binding CopG/RHH family protein